MEHDRNSLERRDTDLAKAYNRLSSLRVNLSTEEYLAISDIMSDLSTHEFEDGLEAGISITKKNYKS